MYKERYEEPTFELFMTTILDRGPCARHQVPAGIPCWHITMSSAGTLAAICNKRARAAGFDHKISPKSLSMARKPPKQSHFN